MRGFAGCTRTIRSRSLAVLRISPSLPTSCSLDGMTFGTIAHSMAVEVESASMVYRDLAILEHQEGEPLRLTFGRDSVNLRPD